MTEPNTRDLTWPAGRTKTEYDAIQHALALHGEEILAPILKALGLMDASLGIVAKIIDSALKAADGFGDGEREELESERQRMDAMLARQVEARFYLSGHEGAVPPTPTDLGAAELLMHETRMEMEAMTRRQHARMERWWASLTTDRMAYFRLVAREVRLIGAEAYLEFTLRGGSDRAWARDLTALVRCIEAGMTAAEYVECDDLAAWLKEHAKRPGENGE